MNPPKKEKTQGANQRFFQNNDQSRSTLINTKHTPEQATRLLFLQNTIQYAQLLVNEYALETDNPPHGLVECADCLDDAQAELSNTRACI